MPHDKNGAPLVAGDIVNLPCRVTSISASEEACNVSLDAIGPDNEYRPSIACNAKLVVKVDDTRLPEGDAVPFA